MSAPVLLKPSEYQGAQGTAVAGRIVICSTQEVESRSKTSSPAAPSKGKGGKGKAGKATLTSSSTKIELHLSATENASEVLYVEAWGGLLSKSKRNARSVIWSPFPAELSFPPPSSIPRPSCTIIFVSKAFGVCKSSSPRLKLCRGRCRRRRIHWCRWCPCRACGIGSRFVWRLWWWKIQVARKD